MSAEGIATQEIAALKQALAEKTWILERTDAGLKALYRELEQEHRNLTEQIIIRETDTAQLQKQIAELTAHWAALDQFAIIAETDLQGRITYVNEQFCRISKYRKEELIGKDHRETVNSGYHPKAFWKEMWKTIGRGEIWRADVKNKAKDGTYYWVDTTIVPMKEVGGRSKRHLALRTLVTDRKQAEEELTRIREHLEELVIERTNSLRQSNAALKQEIVSREQAQETLQTSETRLRTILNSTQDAIISANQRGNIVLWSKAAERIFGYAANDVMGQSLTIIMPKRFQQGHRQGIKRFLMESKGWVIGRVVELIGLHKDGTEFPLELSLASSQLGSQRIFTMVIRDITERQRTEQRVAWLATFPKQNPDPVIEIGTGGEILYENPAAIAAFPDLQERKSDHPVLQGVGAMRIPLEKSQAAHKTRHVRFGEKTYEQQLCLVPGGLRMRIYMWDITQLTQVEVSLRDKMRELEQFKDVTVGREHRMIELKEYINALSRELDRPEPYDLRLLQEAEPEGRGDATAS